MTLALGALLGTGLLLVAAPFLWPRTRGKARSRTPGRLRANLAQAGLGSLPLPAFVALSVVLGLAVSALSQALLGIAALSIVTALAGLSLPTLMVVWRVRARRRANRAVWPDVVDHLVSAVRSGLALPDSVGSLAGAGPLSTRPAFAEFAREYQATGNFGSAVDGLKVSLGDPVADRILETLRMAREVGGSDLTVVLRSLAAWLRQDAAIRSEVEARQSWIVNAARLGVAAPWIVLLLLASRPEAAVAYNTSAGVVVIVGGLGVSVVAYRLMVALGRLPEERRWFK
ncbi:type II secretion system protein F [Cryobacterium sp. TMT1-62]|uniref:type II secretion system F family protein n=1 Tax=unclassified Cryobacterium TaxID=2649013 RepID=UPI000CE3C46E|nr:MULTISPECIES: type II secretion system F family protein [unclassified Cryobacterium]TFB57372.1 type II secretion system protein F [Cryobacterium sp. Sr3]TFC51411.1 type II secretion system protein F [Cryobacterium sp. TMT2-17-1]TFC71616.1 type II secretion system protein F [Cryobacterium sp. TMT2-4]TFD31691.1 type II secretion system protein F [Cryobacterium sp. TMT1-62]TFD34682.1 type II secretion system protein F [Cryobacterium sp. TMT1-19]